MRSMTPAQLTAWNDQEDRRVAQFIREYGFFIQAVFSEGRKPPFAYTVGLFGLGHPELIIFGLDHESAGGTLNWFFSRIHDGRDLVPGEIIEPEGSGMRFLVEVFPNPQAALFAANRHYQRPPEASVPAYQLTWDCDGAFPWEPGYTLPAWLQPRPGEFAG